MSNHLAMDKVQSIQHLRDLGWSQRKIAATLSLDRKSVRRHLERRDSKGAAPTVQASTGGKAAADASKGANAPTGPETPMESGEGQEHLEAEASVAACARSGCVAYHEAIVAGLQAQLSAQRIYQDLITDHGYSGSYWSVNRYVRSLRKRPELPFRRMETAPGEEAQIDFGTGAPYLDSKGKKRRTHVLRVVLSHSRKAYSEVVTRQTTECFITAIENAFHAFGGVPRTLVVDNLKAAVIKADWFDPELNPKLSDFCRYYGTAILPTKPYTPRHKGKVERGVDYVQENALKGRVFESIVKQNEHLANWERTIADTRIHGTLKCQVGKLFESVERGALRPLPNERFPLYQEARRIVSRDGHIEVAKSFYSVPPEYVTWEVWARWDSRLVRVFNHKWEQITFHARVGPGKYSTHQAHIASEKISGIERGVAYLLEKAAKIGPHTACWANAMVAARGVQGSRVLQGLLSLTRKHESQQIEAACEVAWSHRSFRLQSIKKLIEHHGQRQSTFEFLQEHPLIRSTEVYAQFVHDLIQGGV